MPLLCMGLRASLNGGLPCVDNCPADCQIVDSCVMENGHVVTTFTRHPSPLNVLDLHVASLEMTRQIVKYLLDCSIHLKLP